MRRGLGALTALVVLAACGEQIDSPTMLEPPSTSATASAADRYVVVMNRAPDGSTVAVNNITGRLGITADHVYDRAISGFAADLTDAQVADLEADPQVAFVERDQIFRTTGNQSPTPSWGLDRIDQDVPGGDPRLDNSYTYPNSAGSGVEVYMFDTGINMTHTDFAGRLGTGFSAVPGVPNPVDDHGHGSHTAGTVAGATYGVAKSANPIYPVKICNAAGSCFTSWTIAGINWAIGNASLPAVGNMSIGGGFSASLNAAVANAVTAGIFMGVSAGNSNANACGQSPASEPTAHTSGATDITDTRASFSNFGTCVDAFGPGVNITSAWIGSSTATATISGTSMSSPHQVGIAALHLGINPGDTPAQVDAAIKANALVGVVNNAGSGSPNLLVNMNYLNGGGPPPPPPPPPPPGEMLVILTEDATTVTVELTYGAPFDPNGAIGARSATGAPVCPPFATPSNPQASPATTVCQRGATDYDAFGVIDVAGAPSRVVGPVTILAAVPFED